MKSPKLSLSVLPRRLAICRLGKDDPIPGWLTKGGEFFSITRTLDELSIVCEESVVPAEVRAEKGWRAFKIEGPLDLSLTGILASLTSPLAAAEISVFAISTSDTDYLLVKSERLEEAIAALKKFVNVREAAME